MHPDKTRLIRFGRHAAKQRERLGEGKPETFDFLGFTHFCTRSRKWGSFVIGRKTIKKRMRAKLLAIKIELRRIMHDPIARTGAWVKQMLKGHLNYFAVSGNHPSLWWFFNKVKRLWLASLKRRSQTARPSWERFIQFVARFFPPIRTIHPLPCLVTASTQESEGGARCVSSARRDLCGGRLATAVPTVTLGARGTAALVRAVLLWDRLPRDRGEFVHMRSKGLAKVLNAARKLAPLVPHNSEGFAQRLALVGDPGQPQRITMRLHN